MPILARPSAASLSAAPLLAVLALGAVATGLPARAEPAPERLALAQPEAAPVVRPALHRRALARLSRLAALIQQGRPHPHRGLRLLLHRGLRRLLAATTYPAQLQRDLAQRLGALGAAPAAVTVLNRGRGGDDSEAMARRLEGDVLADSRIS